MAEPTPAQTVERSRRTQWSSLIVWLLIVSALVVGFAQNLAEMWVRWFPAWKHAHFTLYERIVRGESYYTHGPVVPLVSFLILLLLVRLTKVPARPRPALGFLVLLGSLVVHMVSCLARVNFMSAFAMIGVLAGIVLVLWGGTALRRLWFPLAFLAFMVPLPEVSIAQLNFRLKMYAADWGVRLANLVGIIAERAGNRVFLGGDKSLVIANVCNGLRTLITVIGFGALYAYVCRLRGVSRLVLFLMSVPVALVANSIRIVGLIVVAHVWDEETATGWFHDTSGAFIFLMAFLMMFGMEWLILRARGLVGKSNQVDKLFKDVRRGPEDERQVAKLFKAAGTGAGWIVAMLLAFSAGGALWLNRSVPPMWDQGMARRALPAVLTINGKEWNSYDSPLDENTIDILETSDYLCRRYVRPEMPLMEFSIVFSKDNRKGTHPPDLCLEGAGDGIVAKRAVVVTGVGGRGDINCRELIVQSGSRKSYFLYVYKCGDAYTASFWKQQFVILVNGLLDRNASGALIRLSTPIVNDDAEDARRRSAEFLRIAIPYLDKGLT